MSTVCCHRWLATLELWNGECISVMQPRSSKFQNAWYVVWFHVALVHCTCAYETMFRANVAPRIQNAIIYCRLLRNYGDDVCIDFHVPSSFYAHTYLNDVHKAL